jgi:hypothetical protein
MTGLSCHIVTKASKCCCSQSCVLNGTFCTYYPSFQFGRQALESPVYLTGILHGLANAQ